MRLLWDLNKLKIKVIIQCVLNFGQNVRGTNPDEFILRNTSDFKNKGFTVLPNMIVTHFRRATAQSVYICRYLTEVTLRNTEIG